MLINARLYGQITGLLSEKTCTILLKNDFPRLTDMNDTKVE